MASNPAEKIVFPMVALMIFGLLLAIFAPLSLNFMSYGADAVSDWANDTITEDNLTSEDPSYFLLDMLANEDLVFILFLSAFILIVVGIALGLIYVAIKGITSAR